ncbi:MAG TPA: hypothetical protein VIF02_12810 [Methylocella sp.]|jgi:hypothetical protein
MENEQNGATVAGMSRHHRSAVTNRTKLFAIEGMDGRLGPARRFRDILEQIECDVGGHESLSEGQKQLCRRAATLSFTAECMEVDAVSGKAFDIDLFGQLTDRLGRCLQRLGLERKTKDVTPTLQSYLATKAQP